MVSRALLQTAITQQGQSIDEKSLKGSVLLVFLRHFGCVFCREAIKDLSKKRKGLADRGVEIVFVHMSDNETAQEYFDRYNITGVDSISDPSCALYQQFGLMKGRPGQLFGLKNWVRGFEVFVKDPTIVSVKQIGDGFQMPGVFLIKDSEVKQSFIHKSAADKPDYDQIVDCCAAWCGSTAAIELGLRGGVWLDVMERSYRAYHSLSGTLSP